MEIQTQAFGYQSNDELNNMTFYYNKIINRSTIRLDSCFMAQWVDPDLGNYTDDFVGCDVPRGLGICYNGDDDDEGIQGYGANPPSVGIDFLKALSQTRTMAWIMTAIARWMNLWQAVAILSPEQNGSSWPNSCILTTMVNRTEIRPPLKMRTITW